jgi:hypothetical protein
MRVGFSQHFTKIIVLLVMLATLLPVSGSIQVSAPEVAQAQGVNLITNPRFDTTWYGKTGIDGQIPIGWQLWANGQPPATDVNQFLPYTRSAPASWVLKGGYVAWTAGGYQTVTVEQGQTYRFTIYAFLWACDDLEYSCTGPTGRSTDTSFNSRVKVGIDPLGGTDPSSANILWTGLVDAPDAFFPQTVDAIAQGGQITVFFYTTVSHAPALRETFWDDASLVQLGEGEGTPLNSGASTGDGEEVTVVEPPSTVPFVTPQQAQADGSVVHIVAEGDTFDSIYVAYRYLGISRDDILSANDWDEPPRWILLGDRITIMPPGSVDPVTGQLLTRSSGASTGGTTSSTTDEDTSDTTDTDTDTGGSSSNTDDSFDVQKGGSLPQGSSGDFFNIKRTFPPPNAATANRDSTIHLTHHLANNTTPDAAQHAAFIFDATVWNISHHNRVYINDPVTLRYRQQLSTGEVCLFFYEDVDTDFVVTIDEPILTDGSFLLNGQQHDIDDQTGITCVLDVVAGNIEIEATIPDGYDALGGQKLNVQVLPEQQVIIPFALTSKPLPQISNGNVSNLTSEDDVVSVIIEEVSEDRSVFEQVLERSAFIIMGLAVFIGFVGGLTVWRFTRI